LIFFSLFFSFFFCYGLIVMFFSFNVFGQSLIFLCRFFGVLLTYWLSVLLSVVGIVVAVFLLFFSNIGCHFILFNFKYLVSFLHS